MDTKIAEENNECCGVEFEKNKFPVWGIVSLAYPLFIICSLLIIIIFPFRNLFSEKFLILRTLASSNFRLIKKQTYFSKKKCHIAGKILKYSPLLSQFFFSSFNFFLISLGWSLVIILGIFGALFL